MPHAIKINRSHAFAPHVPSAQAEIDNSITPMLLDRLTAAELAEVRRCLNAHWFKAREFERHECISEGGVWDEAAQKFRELK